MLERLFNASWYGPWQWTWLLWPLAVLVRIITQRKRQRFLESSCEPLPVPVIVVGNITIGGTGKTPVVQSMVRYLQTLGYRPGIISRGYGGSVQQYPHLIQKHDSSHNVGDEPYMLFHSLDVPVVVDPIRSRGVHRLLAENINVVISDDGLQHYGLHRDYEVCVIDGSRGLGNGQLMPVGPLREHKSRLNSVDFILSGQAALSDSSFQIQPLAWVNVKTSQTKAVDQLFIQRDALAIAGIGNPNKFKQTLNSLGIQCQYKWFADHYNYTEVDFSSLPQQILMTEKDAVKIKPFATSDMWYLQVSANLPDAFLVDLTNKLKSWELSHG